MWILRWLLPIVMLFFLVGFLSQNADDAVTVANILMDKGEEIARPVIKE